MRSIENVLYNQFICCKCTFSSILPTPGGCGLRLLLRLTTLLSWPVPVLPGSQGVSVDTMPGLKPSLSGCWAMERGLRTEAG